MQYIIIPEYISCVVLALIGVYMLFDKKSSSPKELAFRYTLLLSLIAIVNNIVSIYAIENAVRVSVLFNVIVNSLYYFSVAVVIMMVSITTYFTMFEGRYDERRLRTAVIVALAVFALEVALVLVNFATGWLFYFDEQKRYHSGPLNAIGIAFLAIAIASVVWFGALERKRVKKSFRLILFVLPSIA
ncbi:MAG: hypothetical protein Q8S22_04735, partial [Eubacteriales bacterium]|nr:hypothetical protein [Eubacteriales bacterium]